MFDFAAKIRAIPDFPKAGIIFRDITTLLADAEGWRETVDAVSAHYAGKTVEAVVGIEARGFALAGPLAYKLGAKLVLVRKPGKLPWRTARETYALEYGTDTLEIHEDAIVPGERVLIVDDLLATGGTAAAAIRLVQRFGGQVVGAAFIVELDDLGGRQRLAGCDCFALIHFREHGND